MSEPRELPRRVVVAGAGQIGALAAIALRKALPRSEVLVIGTPADPCALADRIGTALAFTNLLHDKLGIDEIALVRQAGASHRLTMRYRGWGGTAHEGVSAYGAITDPRLKTRFARDWGGGPRNASAAAPPGSLAEVLAVEGRFASPVENPALSGIESGLRWNVPAYRDLLIAEAHRLGVRHVAGRIEDVEPDGKGGIASISVGGAGPIEADLYVDCTGPRAELLSRLPAFRRTGWSDYLPIRKVVFGRPEAPVLALEDTTTLAGEGWVAELAGRDGRHAIWALPEDAEARGMEGAVPIVPGSVAEPWLGNVIGLGDAATQFEPLGWLNVDLAHRQLTLLLDLLPAREVSPRERAEFNRRAGLMADAVRDVLGAHYASPGALDRFGELRRSAYLERGLDQFARRGRFPFAEEAPFLTQEIVVLLRALGQAQGEGALMQAAGEAEQEAERASFEAKAEAALRAAPPYGQWLAGVISAGP